MKTTTIEKKGKTVAIFNLAVNWTGFENVNVLIEKGKSIRITGVRKYSKFDKTLKTFVDNTVEEFDRTFNVGDVCIYDSYNFDYTNPIKSVGEKRVAFEGKSLDLAYFIYKNWDYSPEKVLERRQSWSD